MAALGAISRWALREQMLQAWLTRQRVTISEKVVQLLTKKESLVVSKPKRRLILGEIIPPPEDLINQDFHAAAPRCIQFDEVRILVSGFPVRGRIFGLTLQLPERDCRMSHHALE